MLLSTAATQSAQPDYVALAMFLALILIVAVMALHKRFATKKVASVPAAETISPQIVKTPKPTAPGSAGQIKLHDVSPKTAAMIMAIVADKLGKPLNELRFISIKEVK